MDDPSFCAHGAAAELDGRPTCSLTFEVEDAPASFAAFPVLDGQSQTADIRLSVTCVPTGSCRDPINGEIVADKRSSRIDLNIVAQATVTVSSFQVVRPDTVPPEEYRFIDFTYQHFGEPGCGFANCVSYTYRTDYERVR